MGDTGEVFAAMKAHRGNGESMSTTTSQIDPFVEKHFTAKRRLEDQLDGLRKLADAFYETGNDKTSGRLIAAIITIRDNADLMSETFTQTYCVTEPQDTKAVED